MMQMVSFLTAGDERGNLFSSRLLFLVAAYFILSANGEQGIPLPMVIMLLIMTLHVHVMARLL